MDPYCRLPVVAMRHAVFLLAALVAVGCGPGNGVRQPSDPNVVEGDDIERRSIQRVEEMLRGQIAGVAVSERNGQLVVTVRGTTSFNAAPPLFVIDGLPIQQGPNGVLTGLNPHDVASIRVLKDVAETALYGARGANGVVLITTVRPPPPADGAPADQ